MRLQKSRANWWLEKENNTRYFYSLTITRGWRNKILRLKNNEGVWIDDASQLEHMEKEFFLELYAIGGVMPCMTEQYSFLSFKHSDKQLLNRPVSATEVLYAVKNMGAFKAPGLDRLPPIFYQKKLD